ncbi:MAG: type II toxin-antitoxin system HicB family antitoxin [Thermoleophilia bacterium]|nr:type II toxin-antitoxin system HicB family antitoxin [Thermoleophilia bacterium]
MIEYKGYTGVFEFDPELLLFSGHVVDLRDEIYFEGDSVEELQASMRRAVDHYLEVCRIRGDEPERPFSGRLNLRLDSELHRAAAVAAASEGESLNTWLIRVVQAATRTETKTAPPRPTAKRAQAGSRTKKSPQPKTRASKAR